MGSRQKTASSRPPSDQRSASTKGLVVSAGAPGRVLEEDDLTTQPAQALFVRPTGSSSRSRTASGGRQRAPTTSASMATRSRSNRWPSNAGHLLWEQAVDPTRAKRVAARLLADDMWSELEASAILLADHVAYDPLSSTQLGSSVWLYASDNATIAAGFRAYGLDEEAAQVAGAIFEATADVRLPTATRAVRCRVSPATSRLVPGPVPRRERAPWAWSSGALVHLVSTLLGLEANAPTKLLRVRPALPPRLDTITVRGLRVGTGSVDFRVVRRPGGHKLEVLSDPTGFEIDFIEGPLTSR